jgi:hypothetical protein
MNKLVTWLEQHQLPCAWKQHLGFDCPGCGLQSAFIELLKGNLLESIRLYPALIPLIGMMLFLATSILFKIPKSALILKILFIFTVSLLLVSYLIKILIR